MFTAVVTAMLGVVILSAIPVTVDGEVRGLLDLRSVQFNYPTYLWPMILGGVVLGAGFVMSGYCPGTSWVAAASGKLDGLATVGGVVLGGLVYAEAEQALAAFPNSGKLGTLTLPQWLHLPAPVVAAAVVALSIAASRVSVQCLARPCFTVLGCHRCADSCRGSMSRGSSIRTSASMALQPCGYTGR